MTLHSVPLNFLICEENFLFFFISVELVSALFSCKVKKEKVIILQYTVAEFQQMRFRNLTYCNRLHRPLQYIKKCSSE
jgi:hypothetical protein